jgi:O-antigen/teichoic acid export membrane protein
MSGKKEKLFALIKKIKGEEGVKNTFILSSSILINQVINLLCLMVLTRLYNEAAFGFFGLYASIVWILAVIATLQFEHFIVQAKSSVAAKQIVIFILVFSALFCVVIACVIFIFHDEFSYLILKFKGYKNSSWIWFIPAGVLFISYNQALRYWSLRRVRYSGIGKSMILDSIFRNIGSVLLGLANIFSAAYQVFPLIIGQLAGFFANTFNLCRYSVKYDSEIIKSGNFRSGIRYISSLLKRALLLTSSYLLKTGSNRAPIFIVSLLGSASILGAYALVERAICVPITFLANAVSDVFRQRATLAWHENKPIDKLILRTAGACFLIGIPIYLGGIILCPILFPFIFGKAWAEAGKYASVLLVGEFAVFVFFPINPATIILKADRYIFFWHKIKFLLYLAIIPAVIFFKFNIYFILWSFVSIKITMHAIDFVYVYFRSRVLFTRRLNS